ncbi:uncharacterized protein [Drosophila suzukii]|uniref:DUF5641 domain-containing protein n=1 Tax=Drosophila suzukii TaxID=28584 RepID=A0ABM4TNN8_DROSZ
MIRVHLLFGCTLAVLWSRWKEEYLTLLQQRSKWRTTKPGLIVDDFVLVKDENLPPMKWPLARVIELLFGEDGVARVAVLKTASGVTKRAVNNLCLLPFKDDVETQASNGGKDTIKERATTEVQHKDQKTGQLSNVSNATSLSTSHPFVQKDDREETTE